MLIKISVCNRRTDKKYKNKELEWDYIIDRNRNPIRTSETAEEYSKLPKAKRGELKDIGGLVGGWLKDGIRKNGNVTFRTLGLLDADSIPADVNFQSIVRTALDGVTYFLYSTHSHTPETPRCRIVILFGREVSEDEYPAVMRMVAKQIGMDFFDDSTYESNRMMYWASCPSNGEFVFDEQTGEPLDVDKYLGMYADWRDVSQWPTSSRQSEAVKREAAKQEDPLSKPGVVGAFCRAYSVTAVIDKFLPEVYAPSVIEGRYDYVLGEGTAGVVVYDDKFAYSHHATDPACGKLLNAFDLVRTHRFGSEDDKKSFGQMCEMALSDDSVKLQIAEERQVQAQEDFEPETDDWKKLLRYQTRSTVLENSVWNETLILNNDPDFANFAYNELASRVQVTGATPWERPIDNSFWRDADTAQLKALIDVRYVSFSSRNHDVSFTKVADDRRFHPIRDYMNALPEWDKVPRIETLLVRCLQADDTRYVRTVTRKTFAAAVARVYRPGTKYDSILVLDGAQGIGKSTIFKDLVGDEYYSDTLSLTDMNDKSGAEKLQGFWIVEIGELAGMKKADIEKVKAFLSTADDKYRPSYGKTVESHPRQCIIIASVNGERGYLRDITGNRRFWIVKLHQDEQKKRWHFTKEERDQIWAEAKAIYESGEKLYLEADMIKEAEKVQQSAMEVDERQGMVEEYLDTLLPDGWENMDIYARRSYVNDKSDPIRPNGVTVKTVVSNAEIWCECFCRNLSEMKPADSYAIAALMTQVDGWERTNERCRQPMYGRQRLYRRKN
ncbi:MAG TPA: virulence-associated E family protein [Eubacteriales bacterium]|nr:virulence-associated E family protein [Eubacteriales bacterium]